MSAVVRTTTEPTATIAYELYDKTKVSTLIIISLTRKYVIRLI